MTVIEFKTIEFIIAARCDATHGGMSINLESAETLWMKAMVGNTLNVIEFKTTEFIIAAR